MKKNIEEEKKIKVKKIILDKIKISVKKKIPDKEKIIDKLSIEEKKKISDQRKILIKKKIKECELFTEMAQVRLHLGHRKNKWNPKMDRYIYTQSYGAHIIDLVKTYKHLKKVSQFLTKSASQKKTVLFVGTKKHVPFLIKESALECNSFYVNQRWLGGILTNWKTIKHLLINLIF